MNLRAQQQNAARLHHNGKSEVGNHSRALITVFVFAFVERVSSHAMAQPMTRLVFYAVG